MVTKKQDCGRALTFVLAVAMMLPFFAMVASTHSIVCAAVPVPNNDSGIVVSMGDSFASGESLGDYFGASSDLSEQFKSQDFLAHRSQKSWPAQLVVNGDETMRWGKNWFFVATSGAETKHITKETFEKKYRRQELGDDVQSGEVDPQIQVFNNLPDKAEFVTISIGGNDAQFADVMKVAVIHGGFLAPAITYHKVRSVIKDMDTIISNIKQVYHDIHNQPTAQDAHIIVTGYPQLLDPIHTAWYTSFGEAYIINTAVSIFNKKLQAAVEECRDSMSISFVSLEERFKTHGAGSSEEWINGLMFAKSDDLKPDIVSKYISAGSFHPNPEGAAEYADLVNTEIRRIEQIKAGEIPQETTTTRRTTRNTSFGGGSGGGGFRDHSTLTQKELVGTWDMELPFATYCSNMMQSDDLSEEDIWAMEFLLALGGSEKLKATVIFKEDGTYDMIADESLQDMFGEYIQEDSRYRIKGDVLYFEVDEGEDYGFSCDFKYTYDGKSFTLGKTTDGASQPYTGAKFTKR